jgi:hypothetical protein
VSDIKSWSASAASNNAASPNGFPEGMAPSGVNDSARETMAAVRRWYEMAQWIDLGDAPTQTGAATFTLIGDKTAAYAAGRRLKLADSSTLYGTITASSYSNPSTTVTVALDSGSLTGALSSVSVGILTPANVAIPTVAVANGGTGATTAAAARANLDAVASGDLAAAVPVGVVHSYLGSSAPSGWLMLNGDTLGDASSGATQADNSYSVLFQLLWNGMADAQAPVVGGRGASAAADWVAHKKITLPDARGRAVVGTGTGASLTARTHGDKGGEETHVLTVNEMPSHTHPPASGTGFFTLGGAVNRAGGTDVGEINSGNTGPAGSGAAHNNMQPWLALNYIVKT